MKKHLMHLIWIIWYDYLTGDNFFAIYNEPQLFDQKGLNDVIKDLNLSDESSEV